MPIASNLRSFEPSQIKPNVHWAQMQQLPPTPGKFRTIRDIELLYIRQGEARVHFANGLGELAVLSGDLLLIPSAVRHRIELLTEPHTTLNGIHFDFFNEYPVLIEQDIVVQNPADEERFCAFPCTPEGEPAFGLHYSGVPFELVEWIDRIAAERVNAGPDAELICSGYMMVVLSLLTRLHAKTSRPHTHSEYEERIRLLAVGMESNPGGSWSNPDMAATLNVSADHFIRLFKEIVGMSPNRYLQFLRHREAKRLLRDTDLKIELIGRRLGYDDLHNFSKTFKKWQGIAPKAYRQLSIMH